MRKLTILVCITFISYLSFCQDVTVELAAKVATNYMNSVVSIYIYSEDNITNITEQRKNGDIMYYTICYKYGGYVNVASTKYSTPILSYSKEGNYIDSIPNPAYRQWMDGYLEQIAKLKDLSQTKSHSLIQDTKWDRILNFSLSNNKGSKSVSTPLILSKWGQSYTNDYVCNGYNYYVTETNTNCSCNGIQKCPAGCVAVAMAQVVRYWRHPNQTFIQGYDWCNMPDILLDSSTNYTVEREAIAQLIRDCGIYASMNYCKGGNCSSSSVPSKALEGLNTLGFNGDVKWNVWYSNNTWEEMLIAELDLGRPIVYSGGHFAIGDTYGHTFVCDGYDTDGTDYFFHFNWGWRGNHDDWFYIGNLNPSSYHFDLLNSAILGVYPSEEIDCENSFLDLCNYYDTQALLFFNTTGYYPPAPWPFTFDPPAAANVESADINCPDQYRHISSGNGTTYRAYNSITINPGFKVELGAEFTAEIITCPSDCN